MHDDLARRRPAPVRPSPVFLGFAAAAVAGAIGAWNADHVPSRAGDFAVFVFVLAAWVVSLSLHEFGHAYAAYRAGDRSVEARGYLTLNPLRYAHPLLSIVLPLLFIVQGGIGLPGGAVYLHRHAFRSRRAQSLAAAAGPAVNVVVGAVALGLARHHLHVVSSGGLPVSVDNTAHFRFWGGLAFLGLLQVTAAILNLLPIPGLDGWAIIEPYVAPQTALSAEKIKPWGMLGVIVALQVQTLNRWFFDLVHTVYGWSGASRLAADIGHEVFKFWSRQPA